MEQEFEELFRQKIGQFSLEGEMTDAEKNEDWQAISQRLGKKKKRVVSLYWSHAAAILIGALISVALFRSLNGGKQNRAQNSVVVASKEIAPLMYKHDTIYKVQTIVRHDHSVTVKPVGKPVYVLAKTQKEKERRDGVIDTAVTNMVAVMMPAEKVMSRSDSVAPPVIAVANIPRHRMVAVHLMDIENEDRRLIVTDTVQHVAGGLLNKIHSVLVRQNAVTSADNDPYILRYMLFEKSK